MALVKAKNSIKLQGEIPPGEKATKPVLFSTSTYYRDFSHQLLGKFFSMCALILHRRWTIVNSAWPRTQGMLKINIIAKISFGSVGQLFKLHIFHDLRDMKIYFQLNFTTVRLRRNNLSAIRAF
jgi:hypothetical protein